MFELGPNQRKWVEALRSGEYAQGRHLLCASGCYCCLGVLSELAGCEKVPLGEKVLFDGEDNVAPPRAQQLVALKTPGGGVSACGPEDDALFTMNDGFATFLEIADAIEAHPDWYFTESR